MSNERCFVFFCFCAALHDDDIQWRLLAELADDTTESTSEGFPRGCLTVTLTHVWHARTEALRDQRACFSGVLLSNVL